MSRAVPDPIIGHCPKCKKAIFESHAYVWCDGCNEPIPDEINIKRKPGRVASSSDSTLTVEPSSPPGSTPIRVLEMFAYLNLIASPIGALMMWSDFWSRKEASPFIAFVIFLLLVQAIFGSVFLLVIAVMADNLMAIRRNIDSVVKGQAVAPDSQKHVGA